MADKRSSRQEIARLRGLGRAVVLFVASIGLAGGLGGCSGASLGSLWSGGGSASLAPASASLAPAPAEAPETVASVPQADPVKVSMSSIIGAPAGVSKRLTNKLKSEFAQRNIALVKGKGEYGVRGYLAASSEKKGAKLAYIWDVNNSAGKRKHRIIGDEAAAGGRPNDPWSGVNDRVLSAIARETADKLSTWLASNGAAVASVAPRRVQANRIPMPQAGRSSATSKRQLLAMVVPVSGAPGDGKISLTQAISRKLYDKGVKLTNRRSDSVYQVRGVVELGAARGGKQAIRIDWRVYDPNGKRIGTVTQKNNIPPGSLDGKWGGVADAAADAAADGIAKLLPKAVAGL